MRKDIEIHIQTGDIVVSPQNQYKLRDFQWVVNPTGLTRYIYGEITVPAIISEDSIWKDGFFCNIPYTPKYKEFMVRIKREYSPDNIVYLSNPVDGTEWFLVKAAIYGDVLRNIYASELSILSEDNFHFTLTGGYAQAYSANLSDVNIVKCIRQNANMMLACVPTNNYRYPLTGVGLIRWKNGSMSNAALSERLMQEFGDDRVIVNNAGYDYTTQQMQLDLKENS